MRLTLPVNVDGQFEDELSVSAYVQPPAPVVRKNRRSGVRGGGDDCTQPSLRRIIHF